MRKALPFLLLFAALLPAQSPVYTQSGSSTSNVPVVAGPDIYNTLQAVTWRLTYTYTGFTSASVSVVCSPDNGSGVPTGAYVNMSNPYDGTTNPATDNTQTKSGTIATRAMCSHVAVQASGAGTGLVKYVLYGYPGSSNSPAEVGATVIIPGTVDVNVTAPIGPLTVADSVSVTLATDEPPITVNPTGCTGSGGTGVCNTNVAQFGGTPVTIGPQISSASMPVTQAADSWRFPLPFYSSGIPGASVFVYNQNFTLAATAAPFASGYTGTLDGLCIKALITNTDTVYIGGNSSVTNTNGYPLAAGESLCLPAHVTPQNFYGYSPTIGQGIAFVSW